MSEGFRPVDCLEIKPVSTDMPNEHLSMGYLQKVKQKCHTWQNIREK